VFVNGSVPAQGETVAELAGPDSALSVPDPTTIFDFAPAALPPTPETDVYLKQSTFLSSFATGLERDSALALAATQRPIMFGALNEPSGEAAWESIPSWYLVGSKDLVIPASAQDAMARRAVPGRGVPRQGERQGERPVYLSPTDAASAGAACMIEASSPGKRLSRSPVRRCT
jgi:pimeloyl-ACP methyl ester carboxylesterase